MYSIVSSVVLLYICFAVETTMAAENGYIVFEMPDIPCKDSSSVISTCSSSIGYEIPDFSKYPNVPDFSEVRNIIPTTVLYLRILGGEKCSKAGKKYLCEAGYPFRCEDQYIHVDGKELASTCDEGKKTCSSLNATLRDSFFNCSGIADNPAFQNRIPRKVNCAAFPELKNDAYSCDANYKVIAVNATELQHGADGIVLRHKMLKSSNLTDVECEKNVADAVCKAGIPACSNDRTKAVSLLSKQDCYKIVGCVNKTNDANLIKGAHEMCAGLPDGTKAKKYSLDNVYDNKAASHAMAFSTILFIATVVAQRFF